MLPVYESLTIIITITRAYLAVRVLSLLWTRKTANQKASALGADSSERPWSYPSRSADVPFVDTFGTVLLGAIQLRGETCRSLTATARISLPSSQYSSFVPFLPPGLYRKRSCPDPPSLSHTPSLLFLPGRRRAYGRLSLAATCGPSLFCFRRGLPEHIFRTQGRTESDIAETLPPASAGRLSSETAR